MSAPMDNRPVGKLPATMKAVVTTGHGGYEKLVFRDVAVPGLSAGEVLVRVLAAGVNNNEINTRLGWYSASVTTGTDEAADAARHETVSRPDGGKLVLIPPP